jgi:hypothetical protein
VFAYYDTCTGTLGSPSLGGFNGSITNITDSIATAGRFVELFRFITPPQCYLGPVIENITTVLLPNLKYIVNCETVNAVVADGVHSICDPFYTGLFILCMVHFTTVGCLFITLVAVSQFHVIYDSITAIEAGELVFSQPEEADGYCGHTPATSLNRASWASSSSASSATSAEPVGYIELVPLGRKGDDEQGDQ